jgi:hypothetical protein
MSFDARLKNDLRLSGPLHLPFNSAQHVLWVGTNCELLLLVQRLIKSDAGCY